MRARAASGTIDAMPLSPLGLAVASLAFALVACSGGSSSAPSAAKPACDARTQLLGVCPGVATLAVCAGVSCTDGVVCTATVNVDAPDRLSSSAAAATPGTCLVLRPGSYPAVTLPAGVSLLGKSSTDVRIDGIVATAGSSATFRGLGVGTGGIAVTGPGAVTIDRVTITGATGPGLWLVGTDASVVASSIVDGASFGVAADCSGACTAASAKLSMQSVLVHGNKLVGVWSSGYALDLRGSEVSTTGRAALEFGRGLELIGGGTIAASNVLVADNADVGILVDKTSGTLGPDLGVVRNVRGVQIQGTPDAGLTLKGFEIRDNEGISVGLDRGAKSVIIETGLIASTKGWMIPAAGGGTANCGEGILWLGGSSASVADSVTIESSARRPVIIDGTSKGSFAGSFGGGDETLGVIIQTGDAAAPDPGLSIAGGIHQEVHTGKDALPVAAAVEAAGRPTGR
ncbi:MAG: hypothetical protein NVSMB47_07470 [Polyangiales bacterium]